MSLPAPQTRNPGNPVLTVTIYAGKEIISVSISVDVHIYVYHVEYFLYMYIQLAVYRFNVSLMRI